MSRTTTCRTARPLVGALSVIAATAWSAGSYAQATAPPAPPAPESAAPPAPPVPEPPAPPAPPPPVVQPAPPPPAVTTRAEPEPASDHGQPDLDVDARPWAIGYSGLSQVPVGLESNINGPQATPIDTSVPAIGVRYWASPMVGIDFAVGFSWTGGSRDLGGVASDKDSVYAFLVQAGVPLALSTYRHVSFQLLPYAVVGYGQNSRAGDPFMGTTAADLSGTRIEVGARSGFEIFFGFMGLPQLALSATVGFRYEYRKYSTSVGGVVTSDTTHGFSTTVQNSPWDIFAGNVAARYYF